MGIAAVVFPIELLACQISMVCVANWSRLVKSSIYVLEIILG